MEGEIFIFAGINITEKSFHPPGSGLTQIFLTRKPLSLPEKRAVKELLDIYSQNK